MTEVRFTRLLGPCLVLASVVTGCSRPPQAAPAEPPTIPVSQPVEREVTDYVDFTGRTDAVQSVDIRPRVTGYLVKMPFKEGAEVKAGDLLFEIDPRPYQAQLDQAAGPGQPLPGPAQAGQDHLRPRPWRSTPGCPNAVSQQQLDQDQAAVDEAEARVKAYREEPGGLPAQPRVHQGHLADRRPGQPLLPDRSATWSTRTRRC